MTNAELDVKIADAMKTLRSDQVTKAIAKAYKDYMDVVKEEARKEKKTGETLAEATERLTDSSPCENYCYILFDYEGDLRGWTIDHQQNWQRNSGSMPSSAINLSPSATYEEIEHEIGNDLAEALDIPPFRTRD